MYNIAGVNVDMNIRYPRLKNQSKTYLVEDNRTANIVINLSDQFLEEKQKENPHLTREDCEYIWVGSEFYNVLPLFGGFLLHSSAVVYKDEGYLFSASSGTGKSTHTQLWMKRFKGAYILNDDKPAIMNTDKGIYVYGTPFSGKTDLNMNTGVPLKGICVLERGEVNTIEKIGVNEALFSILNQTLRPYEEEKMDILLTLLDNVIKKIPVYKLKCNMDEEAAQVSYDGMQGEIRKE